MCKKCLLRLEMQITIPLSTPVFLSNIYYVSGHSREYLVGSRVDNVELCHKSNIVYLVVAHSAVFKFGGKLTFISFSKINLYNRLTLWSRSARFSDDLQI